MKRLALKSPIEFLCPKLKLLFPRQRLFLCLQGQRLLRILRLFRETGGNRLLNIQPLIIGSHIQYFELLLFLLDIRLLVHIHVLGIELPKNICRNAKPDCRRHPYSIYQSGKSYSFSPAGSGSLFPGNVSLFFSCPSMCRSFLKKLLS